MKTSRFFEKSAKNSLFDRILRLLVLELGFGHFRVIFGRFFRHFCHFFVFFSFFRVFSCFFDKI
jgi:hypothetical protein